MMFPIVDVGALPVGLVLAATLLVACIVILLRRKKGGNLWQGCPPCLPALPIVGSLPFLRGGLNYLPMKFMKITKKLGPVFSFYSDNSHAVVLNGNSIHEALTKKAEDFSDRQPSWTETNLLNPDLRGIVFANYNDTFKKYHTIFLSIMSEFGLGMTQESDERIWREAEKLIENIRLYNGQPIDPRKKVLHYTANVILSVLFGQEFLKKDHHVQQIIKNANALVENMEPAVDAYPLLRFLPAYRKRPQKAKHAQDQLFASLEAAIEHSKYGDPSDISFTRRFLEIEGPSYNHQDLLFILRDLCVASSDSLVETMLWLMFEMANNPHIQVRIHRELDEVVPESRLPSYGDRFELSFTEATTLECGRLHTVAPFSMIHRTSKETEIGEHLIPEHCKVIPNLYSVHMDPEIWTDPENFRPERFLDKDRKKIVGTDNVIPFGVGKRSCMGDVLARQVIFVFFASLLHHFDVRPAEEDKRISVKGKAGLTVGPSAFELRFIRRRNKSLRRMSKVAASRLSFLRSTKLEDIDV